MEGAKESAKFYDLAKTLRDVAANAENLGTALDGEDLNPKSLAANRRQLAEGLRDIKTVLAAFP